ncbi:unnamed protein product [Kluyveromyces dobzhanskii CBS 2104]|uniref:WGS project CCBQ000000000 data, contig 00099 n=1 Tax=Kluyveromyces dobzhanskii CBS 2104 TaxID=1427455 RepID=A0A0A8L451_9SACH|nr:unnamed protein product [Kluyveromyces dobzhanskii CBS 2104]
MTPATPPSSRNKRFSKPDSLLATPERTAESDESGMVTPGTVRAKDRLLPPTRPINLTSPCAALKTPEYTPHKNKHTKRHIEFDQERLQPVSRVLFGSDFQVEGSQNNRTLLPPKRTGVIDFFEGSRNDTCEEIYGGLLPNNKNKLAKQEPGTPSDKITTFELASKWHNESGLGSSTLDHSDEDSNTEQEPVISNKDTYNENPFLSNTIADERLRNERKMKMLQENPDLEDTITYVNKSGKIVSKRSLTDDEKQRFKPTRLFAEELDNQQG